jgi:putative flippase GtrA
MKGWTAEGFRYVIIGIASNVVLYSAYIFLAHLGVEHKTAMTILYFLGVIQTFYFQKRWTFAHDGHMLSALNRYFTAYGLCYVGNLAALYFFVDRLGWEHEFVQAGAIVGFALMLFFLQKFWVFRFGSESFSSTKSDT